MEIIKEIFSNLPLDKLTPNSVLIVAVLIIIAALIITAINRKTDKLDINDKHSKISGSKIGRFKNSNNNKTIKIKLEGSDIKNCEIGCTKDDEND